VTEACRRWQAVCQGSKSVQEYALEFNSALADLTSMPNGEVTENEKVTNFLNGLRASLHSQCRINHKTGRAFDSYMELYQIAHGLEDTVTEGFRSRSSDMFPSNHHAYSRFDRPRFDRGFGRSRGVLKVRGFSARGRGFDRGDRSHHRHVPGFHYGSSPYGAPQSTPLTCYGCGRPGHKQTECPMNPWLSQGSAQVPQAQAHHAGPPNSGRGNAPSGRGQSRGRGRFGWYEDLSFSQLVASHVCLEWGPGIETFVCEDTPNVLMNMQDGHVYAFVFQPRKAHEVLSEYNALKKNARQIGAYFILPKRVAKVVGVAPLLHGKEKIMEGRRNESVALKSAQGEEKVVARGHV
jgi:hypothetical protein